MPAQMKAREDGLARSRSDPAGHLERSGNDGGVWDSVQCILQANGSSCDETRSRGGGEEFHIAVGPSEISSSLCSIISRRMEYLRISFFTSRSSSSSSFWMKLLRTGISNLMY